MWFTYTSETYKHKHKFDEFFARLLEKHGDYYVCQWARNSHSRRSHLQTIQ